MKISKLSSLIAATLIAGAAQAQVIRIDVPDDIPVVESTLTRAEVLADYYIWRLAGLQELNRGEATPNTESLEYRRAQARYEYLRASPQFAALVTELSRRPNAMVVATK